MTDSPSLDVMPSLQHRTDHDEPSVFLAENLLREARRQRGLADGPVPQMCLLDPDGDIVRYLRREYQAKPSVSWACYHTQLWEANVGPGRVGIVGGAVGAPFAVLVAEELLASGCTFLISITSAGKIAPDVQDTGLLLIERALRGEGTSTAYLPNGPIVEADPDLIDTVHRDLERAALPVIRGTSWTTDAPFRETASALATARSAGAQVVEMEAAALYAFGEARGCAVVCFAHVTNAMAVTEHDFEKGPADGAEQALAIISAIAQGYAR
jgi:uridine phosphorylase